MKYDRALAVGLFLLAIGIAPSDAGELLITTTGTITSGSETGGLFGLPTAATSLVGDSYTLEAVFDSLGPNYGAGGGFAFDPETPGTPGSVTAIVNGVPLTTQLPNSLSSDLNESLHGRIGAFFDENSGYSSTGNTGAYVTFYQDLA